jgi:ParB-like chromosome segregation protein Spo0J
MCAKAAGSQNLSISKIRTDGGTQTREGLNQDVIDEYAEAWKGGAEFPDVVVFHDKKERSYWLADGFHRYHGARQAKLKEISVELREGTQRDALLYALQANRCHGLRRTNADKRKAVAKMLADGEWVKWSDRRIAEHVGVSHVLVATVRAESGGNAFQLTRTGRDGKSYEAPAKREPLRTVRDPDAEAPEEPVAEQLDDPPPEGLPSEEQAIADELGAKSQAPKKRAAETKTVAHDDTVVRDQVGNVLPQEVADSFQVWNEVCDEIARHLKDAHHLWEGFRHDSVQALHDAGHLRGELFQAIGAKSQLAELSQLAYSVKADRAYALCPYCKLTKHACDLCKGNGWVNKDKYDRCPEEFKKPGSGPCVAIPLPSRAS